MQKRSSVFKVKQSKKNFGVLNPEVKDVVFLRNVGESRVQQHSLAAARR
jgi:hypothetical protein